MRVLGLIVFPVAAFGLCVPACADALPPSGTAKLAAYQVCRPLAALDMGASGSEASTECTGIVRNLDPQKQPDNLSIHCLESTSARPEAYRYWGTCVEIDSDGDKLFVTYDGVKTGQFKWIGGTGKYKDVMGSGALSVVVAPSGPPGLFAYTLNFDGNWTTKAK